MATIPRRRSNRRDPRRKYHPHPQLRRGRRRWPANRSGLQLSTLRDIALAWIFTLPAAAVLSGGLFWLFNLMAR